MRHLTIPEAKDVICGELAVPGDWVVANIATNMFWPVKAQKVAFCGVDVWVMPLMKDRYPALAINRPPGRSREDCERLLMRFLSTLCWVERRGALVDGIGGGSLPNPMGREKQFGLSVCEQFELDYFPEVTDPKAQLALGLMREGRGLNHPAYAFLSFYRVLESAGANRDDWINGNLDKIRDHAAREVRDRLRKETDNVGGHLRESGRNAAAHARSEPIIDPDDPSDARRLFSELPLIAALAELAIQTELGVQTRDTVWDEHFYELAGFKAILGEELVQEIIGGQEPANEERMVDMPPISVELYGHPAYPPLKNLQPFQLARDKELLIVDARSTNGCFGIRLGLDFKNERIHFDINSDLGGRDDGSAEGAESMSEVGRFVRDYWGNGKLRIVNADTGALISRKDAFIPVNCWLDVDAANAGIAEWKRRAEERRHIPAPPVSAE
jgi:hypothetical protein